MNKMRQINKTVEVPDKDCSECIFYYPDNDYCRIFKKYLTNQYMDDLTFEIDPLDECKQATVEKIEIE